MEALRAALEEFTRERAPLGWVTTQRNHVHALLRLGKRERGTERLEQAVNAYVASLEELVANGLPQYRDMVENNLSNVVVLDTGVHGNHPCLAERVRKFIVIDPLGRRIEASPSFDSARYGTHIAFFSSGHRRLERRRSSQLSQVSESGFLREGTRLRRV